MSGNRPATTSSSCPRAPGRARRSTTRSFLNINSEAKARNLIRDNVLDINSTVIEAFLVNSINAPTRRLWLGLHRQSRHHHLDRRSSPPNRFDTLAHEIGHNFGLDHGTFGNNPQASDNLMSAFRTVPTALNQLVGNGGTLDKLNTQQVTEARNGVTVDPTSSIGQATGRVTVAPIAHNCQPLVAPPTNCSLFDVDSTGAGSFVRAIEITIPGSAAPTPWQRTCAKRSTRAAASMSAPDYSYSYEFDAVGDIFTVTLLNRGLHVRRSFRTITGFSGGQASQFKFYFSDGYEVAVAYDGIFANSQDPDDFLGSTFRGAVPETGDINTVLPSPIVTGTLSGPFDLADPTVVPEPGSLALILTAFAAIGAAGRPSTPSRQ